MKPELPLPPIQCPRRYTAEDFFQGISWFNIPEARRADITIKPLYPRGRLLGGNPDSGPPKVSKLAALAASRKRKENVARSSSGASSAVALLDKLGPQKADQAKPANEADPLNDARVAGTKLSEKPANVPIKSYASRRRRSPTPPKVQTKLEKRAETQVEQTTEAEKLYSLPSPFAATLLGSNTQHRRPSAAATSLSESLNTPLIFGCPHTESKAFSGPSPDDIVAKAQSSSKGAKRRTKAKDKQESD